MVVLETAVEALLSEFVVSVLKLHLELLCVLNELLVEFHGVAFQLDKLLFPHFELHVLLMDCKFELYLLVIENLIKIQALTEPPDLFVGHYRRVHRVSRLVMFYALYKYSGVILLRHCLQIEFCTFVRVVQDDVTALI